MTTNSEQVRAIADAIRAAKGSSDPVLESLDPNELTSIVGALLDDETTAGSADPVSGVMTMLERLAPSHEVAALALMAALYPAADERFHHDVCDAIDIWMHSTHNADLVDVLRAMSRLNELAEYRPRLEFWARDRPDPH